MAHARLTTPAVTFPQLVTDYFDMSQRVVDQYGLSTLGFYQNGDWYPESSPGAGDEIFVIPPYSDPTSFRNGTLAINRTANDGFTKVASYQGINLNGNNPGTGVPLVHANAYGFGAGCPDGGDWYHLIACHLATGSGATAHWIGNPWMVRANVPALRDPATAILGSTYQKYDISTNPSCPIVGGFPATGYYHGVRAPDGYVYFGPTSIIEAGVINTRALRYNAADTSGGAFTTHGNWQWSDMRGPTPSLHPTAGGMQSLILGPRGRYVYYVAFGAGYSLMVRYDTQGGGSFDNTRFSYLDLSRVAGSTQRGGPRAFTGALPYGSHGIVLIPWKDNSVTTGAPAGAIYPTDYSQDALMSEAVLVDEDNFTPAGCSLFNLLQVANGPGNIAAGYEFGFVTNEGMLVFIPTGIYHGQSHVCLPIVAHIPDATYSAAGFKDKNRWQAYPDPGWLALSNPSVEDLTAVGLNWFTGGCGGGWNTRANEGYISAIIGSFAPGITQSGAAGGTLNHGVNMRIKFV